jgi:hypothetical protein
VLHVDDEVIKPLFQKNQFFLVKLINTAFQRSATKTSRYDEVIKTAFGQIDLPSYIWCAISNSKMQKSHKLLKIDFLKLKKTKIGEE